MQLKQLEYFIKVTEVGNITQAAKELFVSQPTLSHAIKELEDEMNITLFNRSQKGVTLTQEGEEFLRYAQQIMEQVHLTERRYKSDQRQSQIFSVSAQHYAFVVDAFVRLLKEINEQDYQATLKETRTYEVIEDVAELRSEVGVIYRSHYNRQVINQTLEEHHLTFTSLHKTRPYVFLDTGHPLAGRDRLTLDDLKPYPKLAYEQGSHNSYYYWEEILADAASPKTIIVSDRATLFNLLIGLDGYTISSGIINDDLNGPNILAVPLVSDEMIELGYLTNDLHRLNPVAERYLILLKDSIAKYAKSDKGEE